ncbi:MAG TPA: acyl-CoA dehydrogenase family protein [Thermoplasmata archaeon]|nr:acyl-CoA dehydrogenase family protein [Thermoplasmata archaeon]
MAAAEATDAVRWRARARRLAEEELRPLAAEIDRADAFPASVVASLAREGLFGLGLPERWGGVGGDTRSVAGVLEELASASAAVAVELAVHLSVCAQPILRAGSDAQRQRYLPALARGELLGAFALSEPGVGSDAAALRTRYRRLPEGFELEGTKMFISNAVSAGVVLVFATTDPTLGHRGISAFVVPPRTPGFSVAQRLGKLGLRGSETTEVVLERVRLPPEALLGDEGGGLAIALEALAGGRVGIAACALGVARAAFEEMARSVRRADAEWKRHLLARSFAELSAARAVVDRAAERKDAGEPFVLPASVAKLLASRAAVRIASAGIDVAGDRGGRAGAEAERLYRDARVFPIVEGTSEIQELIIARAVLDAADGRTLL